MDKKKLLPTVALWTIIFICLGIILYFRGATAGKWIVVYAILICCLFAARKASTRGSCEKDDQTDTDKQ